MDAVERAAVDRESSFSTHSQKSILFHETVLKTSSHILNTLRKGLVLDFKSQPGPYFEGNNMSAKKHMDIVRGKVQEWIEGGYMESLPQQEYCCNPLSVVIRYDALTDKTKFRVVLDLSRHVNNFINYSPVQLDDLAVAEAVLEPGDFLTAYDLKNLFFHVKLHPEMKKFFGFAVPDEFSVVGFLSGIFSPNRDDF